MRKLDLRKRRVINQSDIEYALKLKKSINGAAKYLHLSYTTLRKYTKQMHPIEDPAGILPPRSLFEIYTNPKGIGIHKPKRTNIEKFGVSFDDVISGKYPKFPRSKIMPRLFSHGYKQPICEKCGFSEERVTDYKVPLMVNYKDDDKTNFLLSNLEILCYNCYFLWAGDVLRTGYKKKKSTPDVKNDTSQPNSTSTDNLVG